jgi:hypothetical protein
LQVRGHFSRAPRTAALIRNREKKLAEREIPPEDRRQGVSFEERLNRRLELWLARHPGLPPDEIQRKRKSIARRLSEEEEAERQDRQK